MSSESSAWEIITGEIEKIQMALIAHPQLGELILPCLERIRHAAEGALPCPVLPAISLREYSDQLPEVSELQAAVKASGGRFEFHGYTFWQTEENGWSLTNPLGMDDVMLLRDEDDFERFLVQLRMGAVIGLTA